MEAFKVTDILICFKKITFLVISFAAIIFLFNFNNDSEL